MKVTTQAWLRDDLENYLRSLLTAVVRSSKDPGDYERGFAEAIATVATALGIKEDELIPAASKLRRELLR